jgi:hypothetical protein
MPHEKSYDAFFTQDGRLSTSCSTKTTTIIVGNALRCITRCTVWGPKDIDIYSTKRWRRDNFAQQAMVGEGEKPGLDGHPQSDSLGDRGEFDEDNSGGGKLYVGVFDRKLHLAGAEWGAWTVDKNAEYHGGVKTPSPKPLAPRVEEVVKYTDTDNNGFLDTVEYDYDGDRTIDFKFSLLDYKSAAQPAPGCCQSYRCS